MAHSVSFCMMRYARDSMFYGARIDFWGDLSQREGMQHSQSIHSIYGMQRIAIHDALRARLDILRRTTRCFMVRMRRSFAVFHLNRLLLNLDDPLLS